MAISLTSTVTQEVALKPAQKKKLLTELRTYAELKGQIKTLEAEVEKHKSAISKLRDETGQTSLSIEGFTTTLVVGERKVFDEHRFIANGGDIEIYNSAIKVVPNKAYEKVTCPREKDSD